MVQRKKYLTESFTEFPALRPAFEFIRDTPGEPDRLSAALVVSVLTFIGYTEGGTQVRAAAVEKLSKSCRAVGRVEHDSLQHNCTDSQTMSEKPNDSA